MNTVSVEQSTDTLKTLRKNALVANVAIGAGQSVGMAAGMKALGVGNKVAAGLAIGNMILSVAKGVSYARGETQERADERDELGLETEAFTTGQYGKLAVGGLTGGAVLGLSIGLVVKLRKAIKG